MTKKQLIESAVAKITKKVMNEEYNYYTSELGRLQIDAEYSPTIVVGNGNGQKTKTISINRESLPILIKWLKSIEKKLPR